MFRGKPVEIRTAPHLKRPQGVDEIMRNVVYALLPIAGFSVWQFGISSLALRHHDAGGDAHRAPVFAPVGSRATRLATGAW